MRGARSRSPSASATSCACARSRARSRGPTSSPATRAALAFAESCGTRVEALEQLDEGKGKFLFFIGTKPGERAMDLLPDLVREVLDALPIPRRMHWGEGTAMFVRPVHWVVMLLGSEVVPATLLDTPAGHFTRGHRFHAPRRSEEHTSEL